MNTAPSTRGVTPDRVQDPSSKLQDLCSRLRREQSGLSTIEKIGMVALVISVLAFIPPVRSLLGDFYDAVFNAKVEGDPDKVTSGARAARGVLIVGVAIVGFLGSGLLLLYTNLGKRLAFLVAGTATFGWLVIGGALFTVYAPRGLRPRVFAGLNSFQIRVPAIAMTLGATVLFLMFMVALDKYERESEEA